MWVKVEVIPGEQNEVYLPVKIAEKINSVIKINFGKRSTNVMVIPSNELEYHGTNTFENPIIMKISGKLKWRLLIPDPLVCQMKLYKNHMILGPVIGFLIGNRNHIYSPRHMEKYSDRFGIYDKVGGLIYAFSPRAVDWEKKIVYGLYYNYQEKEWKYGRFPYPTVIYRRDFHTDPDIVKRLIDITGSKLFNSWRFSKFYLYQFVKRNKELSMHLPATQLFTNYERAKEFIDLHGDVILKPVSLSRGRGICIIKKEGSSYKILDYRGKQPLESVVDVELLKGFLVKNNFSKRYIMQKCLSLAKIDGNVFDIRIVMQKDRQVSWKISGIECRVANNKLLLTNISRGGYALPIEDALKQAFPDSQDYETLTEELFSLCHRMCNHLDKMGHHYAEFGMDIAIDEDKRFWIIEVNVFPSFKGFKKMDPGTYLTIRYTPILYASYLAGF